MYLLAIDGGGSNCRAALCNMHGRILGTANGKAANIATDFDTAFSNIMQTAYAAFGSAGIQKNQIGNTYAVLGLAGANLGNHCERLTSVLQFKKNVVESDALIALQGAFGDEDGTVAVIGTGSVFITRHQGQIKRICDWGFMLGDFGSGAAIGKSLLQEVMLAYDKIRPSSSLTRKIMSQFKGDPQNIANFAKNATPGEFASLCPLVFSYAEKQDQTAKMLIRHALADVEKILDSITAGISNPVCFLGGLSKYYHSAFSKKGKFLIHEPAGDALIGAINLAIQRFGDIKT